MLDKKALRKEIGALKRGMSDELIEAYSRDLTEKFCQTEQYRRAASLYAYLPYNQEVRTWGIIERAWADGKRVAVPKVYGDEMRFLWIENFENIAPGGWDIPEPTFDAPVADDAGALVLMPGLAFDPEGHRVGYGGGFYDKYLQAEPGHPLVALCYPFQMKAHLEVEAHDIPVDLVICAEDDLKLVPPTEKYAEQIAAYRQAFLDAGDSMDGASMLDQVADVDAWLQACRNALHEETQPDCWVPATQLLCVRQQDDKLVGMIQIRHRFNDFLEKYGGHIGYSVLPAERRKGYARRMLRAALPLCRELGLARVLVTCNCDNEASRRTIRANGGVYEGSVRLESENKTLERYWIET